MSEEAPRARFLAARHADFGVADRAVVALVERGTGQIVRAHTRVIRGDDNEVHRVELADHSTVYARIARTGEHAFDHEVWAMEQARAGGVPVPEVLSLEVVRDASEPRQAMVIAAAPGRQLSELGPALTASERWAVWADAGGVLARLHEVRMPGVWRPDPDGEWPDAAHYREAHVAARLAERPLLEAAGLSATEIDQVFALLVEPPDGPLETLQSLCHGDFSPEHVFVDEDLQVSGVIDWGLWRSSSAVADLAVASWLLEPQDSDALVEGHNARTVGRVTARDLDATIAAQAIPHIAWAQSVGDAAGLSRTVPSMRQALRRLALS